MNLQYSMILEYTEQVEKLHLGSHPTKLAADVANYVRHHLSEPISTERMADALYLAVSTDTGCFQYSNVTGDTLRTAAALKDLGADTFSINKTMFGTKTIARLRLESALTNSAEFYAEGLVAVCCISQSLMDSIGATEDHAEDSSGFPRTW